MADKESFELYKAATNLLSLLSSEYGAPFRESNPELIVLAKTICDKYQNKFMSYRLETDDSAEVTMNTIEEFRRLLDILTPEESEIRKQVVVELTEKTSELQQKLLFTPKAFYDKYMLNLTSPHIASSINPMENERFRLWFAGSTVVDADGNPLKVYHGTSGLTNKRAEFTKFSFQSFPVAYFAKEKSYSEWFSVVKGRTGVLFECYLRITNPIDLTGYGVDLVKYDDFVNYIKYKYNFDLPEAPSLRARSNAQGGMWAWLYLRNGVDWLRIIKKDGRFDGIVYYENNPQQKINGKDNVTMAWVIFNGNQVKTSDFRNTTFSLNDDNFSRKKGGKI